MSISGRLAGVVARAAIAEAALERTGADRPKIQEIVRNELRSMPLILRAPAARAGMIDPTKIVRTALQGAVSIAGLMITAETMVAGQSEKNNGRFDAAPEMGGIDDIDF